MIVQHLINKSYRTKLRTAAAANETTLEKLFLDGLELLFSEYEGVIDGREDEALIPFITSAERVPMNFEISKDENKKLIILSRRTGLSKANLCNIAIQLILQELGFLK